MKKKTAHKIGSLVTIRTYLFDKQLDKNGQIQYAIGLGIIIGGPRKFQTKQVYDVWNNDLKKIEVRFDHELKKVK